MRTLQLVGVIKNARLVQVAKKCAWCRGWVSIADYVAAHKYNAHVNPGAICPSCAERFKAESPKGAA